MNDISFKSILAMPFAAIAFLVGDFDLLLEGLMGMVVVDFITGLLKAWHNDDVTSKVMFKGGIEKVGIFLIVATANIIDNSLGLGIALRGLVIGYYMVNEALSMLENWGGLGLPLPKKLINVLAQLKETEEKE